MTLRRDAGLGYDESQTVVLRTLQPRVEGEQNTENPFTHQDVEPGLGSVFRGGELNLPISGYAARDLESGTHLILSK